MRYLFIFPFSIIHSLIYQFTLLSIYTIGKYGFQFLLVFVFATIPAGIISKLVYHDILANVDVLHGIAESFLTITNLLIIQGFRSARGGVVAQGFSSLSSSASLSTSSSSSPPPSPSLAAAINAPELSDNDKISDSSYSSSTDGLNYNDNNIINSNIIVAEDESYDIIKWLKKYQFSVLLFIPAIIILINYWLDSGTLTTVTASLSTSLSSSLSSPSFPVLSSGLHVEPSNALSFPTWIIHTSSLLEWLAAMQLIWDHAYISNNPRWKGLTWAMVLSHASGLCACTYHLFYNSPVLLSLVSLQAALTVLGNIFLALTAYRIYYFEQQQQQQQVTDQEPLSQSIFTSNQQALIDNDDVVPSLTTTVTTTISTNDSDSDDAMFWLNLFIKSTLFAIIVKYGELYSNIPFEPSLVVATSIIGALTMTNVLKWLLSSSSLPLQASGKVSNNSPNAFI